MEQHGQETELRDFLAARQAFFTVRALPLKKPIEFEDLRLTGKKAKRQLNPLEHIEALERIGVKVDTI